MQALVRYGLGDDDIRLEEVPEPSPGPGEVKIEVKAVGVCGTDIHGHPKLKPPVILGHELSGVVVELGDGAKLRRVGERVTSETTAYICGTCRYCKVGDYNLCPNRRGIATKAPGAFAKYFVIREASTHVLPDNVGFAAGALCEPLSCATHAVIERAELRNDETALVVGPGPLGLLVVQVAKAVGARVVVAGMPADAERLRMAAKYGAERSVDVAAEDLKEVVRSLTDGYGADVAFECSGAAPAVKSALDCVRVGGRYVQGGILHREVSLDFDDVFFNREITMIGSRTQKPSAWRKSLELLRAGKLDLESLISEELPLDRWREAFRKVRDKSAVKIVLVPS